MSSHQDLYKNAGVDVTKGDELVDWLQESGGPKDPRVISGVGGFAALFRPNFKGMQDPLLVASTDGVGTKVLLGTQTGKLTGLGQDLVAMCVNDLYCTGATPLFFLDYYATSQLEDLQFKQVLSGIQAACRLSSVALLGGETAEMPGLYPPKEFDLAGFVVGMVDGTKTLGSHRVKEGDLLYGIPSSGFHSNGYSLVRRWIKDHGLPLHKPEWADFLMAPTAIYHQMPSLIETLGIGVIHALAHITGGGISGNLPRVLPEGAVARIDFEKIPILPMMDKVFKSCGVRARDMESIFNVGCGMIAVIEADHGPSFEKAAIQKGLMVKSIGSIQFPKSHENKPAEVLYET